MTSHQLISNITNHLEAESISKAMDYLASFNETSSSLIELFKQKHRLDEGTIALAIHYNIPYQIYYACECTRNAKEEEISDYAYYLEIAETLGIVWDDNTYQPEILRQLVNEKSLTSSIDSDY